MIEKTKNPFKDRRDLNNIPSFDTQNNSQPLQEAENSDFVTKDWQNMSLAELEKGLEIETKGYERTLDIRNRAFDIEQGREKVKNIFGNEFSEQENEYFNRIENEFGNDVKIKAKQQFAIDNFLMNEMQISKDEYYKNEYSPGVYQTKYFGEAISIDEQYNRAREVYGFTGDYPALTETRPETLVIPESKTGKLDFLTNKPNILLGKIAKGQYHTMEQAEAPTSAGGTMVQQFQLSNMTTAMNKTASIYEGFAIDAFREGKPNEAQEYAEKAQEYAELSYKTSILQAERLDKATLEARQKRMKSGNFGFAPFGRDFWVADIPALFGLGVNMSSEQLPLMITTAGVGQIGSAISKTSKIQKLLSGVSATKKISSGKISAIVKNIATFNNAKRASISLIHGNIGAQSISNVYSGSTQAEFVGAEKEFAKQRKEIQKYRDSQYKLINDLSSLDESEKAKMLNQVDIDTANQIQHIEDMQETMLSDERRLALSVNSYNSNYYRHLVTSTLSSFIGMAGVAGISKAMRNKQYLSAMTSLAYTTGFGIIESVEDEMSEQYIEENVRALMLNPEFQEASDIINQWNNLNLASPRLLDAFSSPEKMHSAMVVAFSGAKPLITGTFLNTYMNTNTYKEKSLDRQSINEIVNVLDKAEDQEYKSLSKKIQKAKTIKKQKNIISNFIKDSQEKQLDELEAENRAEEQVLEEHESEFDELNQQAKDEIEEINREFDTETDNVDENQKLGDDGKALDVVESSEKSYLVSKLQEEISNREGKPFAQKWYKTALEKIQSLEDKDILQNKTDNEIAEIVGVKNPKSKVVQSIREILNEYTTEKKIVSESPTKTQETKELTQTQKQEIEVLKKESTEILESIKQFFPGMAEFEVFGTVQEFPDDVKKAIERSTPQGETIEPSAFRYNGKVYVVAKNFANKADMVATTILHEQVMHQGIRNVFGEETINTMMTEVYNSFSEQVDEFASSHGYENFNEQIKSEEYIANIAEKVLSMEDLTAQESSVWSSIFDWFMRSLDKVLGRAKDTPEFLTIEDRVALDAELTSTQALKIARVIRDGIKGIKANVTFNNLQEATQKAIVDEKGELSKTEYEIVEYPVDKIEISEEKLPNFKRDADPKTGLVNRLSGEYKRISTPPVVLWEMNNGSVVVATGRHKLDLAKQNKMETIPAQVLKESDGWTKERVQILDAESNIIDEKGSVEDYAFYFRNANYSEKEAKEAGLLGNKKAKIGFALGRYASDNLYSFYKDKKITAEKASAIANEAKGNTDLERVGMKASKEKDSSTEKITQTIKLAKIGGNQEQLAQGDLFGADNEIFNRLDKQREKVIELKKEVEQTKKALNQARKYNKALKISKEKARELGITDVNDKEQIEEAYQKTQRELERWERWDTDEELVQKVTGEIQFKINTKTAKGKRNKTIEHGIISDFAYRMITGEKITLDKVIDFLKQTDLNENQAEEFLSKAKSIADRVESRHNNFINDKDILRAVKKEEIFDHYQDVQDNLVQTAIKNTEKLLSEKEKAKESMKKAMTSRIKNVRPLNPAEVSNTLIEDLTKILINDEDLINLFSEKLDDIKKSVRKELIKRGELFETDDYLKEPVFVRAYAKTWIKALKETMKNMVSGADQVKIINNLEKLKDFARYKTIDKALIAQAERINKVKIKQDKNELKEKIKQIVNVPKLKRQEQLERRETEIEPRFHLYLNYVKDVLKAKPEDILIRQRFIMKQLNEADPENRQTSSTIEELTIELMAINNFSNFKYASVYELANMLSNLNGNMLEAIESIRLKREARQEQVSRDRDVIANSLATVRKISEFESRIVSLPTMIKWLGNGADENTRKELEQLNKSIQTRIIDLSNQQAEKQTFLHNLIVDFIADEYGESYDKVVNEYSKAKDEYRFASIIFKEKTDEKGKRVPWDYDEEVIIGSKKLSKANLIQLYMSMIQDDYPNNPKQEYRMAETFEKIRDLLTEKDKNLINFLQEVYDSQWAEQADQFYQISGVYPVKTTGVYSPIRLLKPPQESNFSSFNFNVFPKHLIERTKSQHDFNEESSFFAVFDDFVHDATHFTTFGDYGFYLRDVFANPQLRADIINSKGKAFAEELMKRVVTIARNKTPETFRDTGLETLRHLFTLRRMAFNVPSSIRQLSSIFSFGLEVRSPDLLKNIATFLTPDGIKTANEMLSHQELQRRFGQGFSEPVSAVLRSGNHNRIMKLYSQWGMIGQRTFDILAMLPYGQGFVRSKTNEYMKVYGDYKKSFDKAMLDFSALYNKTQQSGMLLFQSGYQLHGGTLWKWAGTFAQTQRQMAEYYIDAYSKIVNKEPGAIRNAGKVLLFNNVIIPLMFEGLDTGLRYFLNGEEPVEEIMKRLFYKMLLGQSSGLLIYGGMIELTTGMLTGQYNPMHTGKLGRTEALSQDIKAGVEIITGANEVFKDEKKFSEYFFSVLSNFNMGIRDMIRLQERIENND